MTTAAWPSISEHSYLRLFVVFILYIAQGLPYGLFFFAIPGWLAASEVSALAVGGFISAASLPWTLKFMHGFFMDRYAYLPMGRRRAWLIGAQFCMVFGLLICAVMNPDVSQIALLSAFGFTVMLATTLQDVAVDGMAVDLLKDEERAKANGLMFGGQSVGIAAGGAVGGYLIAAYGLAFALVGVGVFLLLVLILVAMLRERPGEKLLPWSPGETSAINLERHEGAWLPLLRRTFRVILRRRSLILMIGVILINASWGFFLGLGPLVATSAAGWTDAMYSSTSGAANFVSGILAILVFGLLVYRVGTRWGMVLATIILSAMCLFMALNEPLWADSRIIKLFIYVAICMYVLILVVWAVTAMRMCSPEVAATQFALYMAVANLGISLGAALLGPIESLGGYAAVFAAIAVGLLLGGVIFYLFAESGNGPAELQPVVD
ncbi:MAG: MFS transporter [Pseudomonadota bacterium]